MNALWQGLRYGARILRTQPGFILLAVVTLALGIGAHTAISSVAKAGLPRPQEQTVEQVRKNIQVLQGLPDAQLFPVMNFIGDSLGVHCDYCHVKERDSATGRDQWLWEREDKPQKIRAREMMKMVLALNKASFGGAQAVTCYSCHRGSTRVERLVPSPPLDFTAPKADERSTASVTAAQILAKYNAAVGGQEAGAKVKTIVLTGRVERSQGRNGAVKITVKGTDKYLVELGTPQGSIRQGTDGAVGWSKDNQGVRQLAATDVAQLKQVAAMYGVIKVTEPATQMTVPVLEKLGEREAYVVSLTTGSQTTRKYFFDAQTGLLLRRLTLTRTLLAPLPEQVDFEDYREVDGVKLPFTIRTSDVAAFSTTTRRFTAIRLNAVIDEAIFKLPSGQQ